MDVTETGQGPEERVVSVADPAIRDFSYRRAVRFRLDHADGTPDYFDGLPELPALLLVDFAAALDSLNEVQIRDEPKIFADIFRVALTDESAERFVARMQDKVDPIGLRQVEQVVDWLMEQYGFRPTTPPPDSSNGSGDPDGGMNSTDDASSPESISSDSPPTDSST